MPRNTKTKDGVVDDPVEIAYGPMFKEFFWGIKGFPHIRNNLDNIRIITLSKSRPSPKAVEMAIPWIKGHEGYEGKVYPDPGDKDKKPGEKPGPRTVGFGHAFTGKNPPPPPLGTIFTPAQCEALFNQDMERVKSEYSQIELPPMSVERQAVILDMLYNLGPGGLGQFTRMLEAIRTEDWGKAADEMLDSTWAGQVKGRATELADIMRTGCVKGRSKK